VQAPHASIIQGSALGPASYAVNAGDLRPLDAMNRLFKYADDTYLVVPAVNSSSCNMGISHIESRAATNNLRLNSAKSKEIIFTGRGKRDKLPRFPPPCFYCHYLTVYCIANLF